MKYLDYITGIINTSIEEALPFGHKQILGVAQVVRKQEDNGRISTMPAIYGEKGELTYAGYDDTYHFRSYHRALNMNVTDAPDATYGDNDRFKRLSHRMSLVIMADREKTGHNADQIALILQFAVPGKLTKDALPSDFKSTTINITDVVLSESQVFSEEFTNVEYFLGPEHVLLKCNYTIESVLNKRCFNTRCQPVG